MKKGIIGLTMSVAVGAVSLFGFSNVSTYEQAHRYPTRVELNLNGVHVSDISAHKEGEVVYVSVDTFAKHYGTTWSLNEKNNKLSLNGKNVTNEYGSPKKFGSVLVAPVQALAETLGDADSKKEGHYETGFDKETNTENVTILPKGVQSMENHFTVPNMGSHWMNPADPTTGPIWGTYKGKLVFLEYMPDNDLDHDVTLKGTQGVPIPAFVDHTDINWNPHGHPGDTNPHHDVHLYFISVEEQSKIK